MVEPPKDEIRQYSSAFGSAQERIEKIYIPNDDFNSQISKINERLTSILDPKAELLLTGEIDYFESESADNNGFKVTRASILEQVTNYRIYLKRQPPSLLVPRAKKPLLSADSDSK